MTALNEQVETIANMIVADGYEYKSLMDGAAAQLPSASKSSTESGDILQPVRVPGTTRRSVKSSVVVIVWKKVLSFETSSCCSQKQ